MGNATANYTFSANETTNYTFSEKSEDAPVTFMENVNLVSLLFLTAPVKRNNFNELMLLVKGPLACLFLGLISTRRNSTTFLHELLLIMVCSQSVAGTHFTACDFIFMWAFYQYISHLINFIVLLKILFCYVATFIILAYAPTYFPLFAYIIDIHFVYAMYSYFLARNEKCSLLLLFITLVAFGLFYYFDFFSSTPGPDMIEMNLILIMFAAVMGIGFQSAFATLVLGYCALRN